MENILRTITKPVHFPENKNYNAAIGYDMVGLVSRKARAVCVFVNVRCVHWQLTDVIKKQRKSLTPLLTSIWFKCQLAALRLKLDISHGIQVATSTGPRSASTRSTSTCKY